jgi:biopolymer transport protein ExbD
VKRRSPAAGRPTWPSLAPMVDVIMVILIFFMLGTRFKFNEAVLPTELPADVGPGTGAAVTVAPVVRIGLLGGREPRDCVITVMDQAIQPNEFGALSSLLVSKRQAGADPTGRVIIEADPGVQYRHVVSAFDACVRAGFENVQFAVPLNPAAGVDESTS